MGDIDANTATVLKDFGTYFKENSGVTTIEAKPFMTFFALAHPKLTSEAKATYKATIANIQHPAPPGTEDGIKERLVELATASKLKTMLEGYEEGEIDLTQALRTISDRHETWVHTNKKHPKVKDRIEDMLLAVQNDTGFHFRLNCLNAALKPLWEGDFIIVAARVDSGKSSFFASELSYMAPQVDTLYPGQDRTIIVLNNEGPGRKLRHRYFNASLGMSNQELIPLCDKGVVYDEFLKTQGGRDLFHVFDIHDYTMGQLEDIVKDLNPAIVVVDMLDNVQADGQAANGGTRTDQILEWMYQRARIWAVKYKCVVIATSQLSGEAEGELFPKLSQLANSKTGKAGAAEAVIMLGRSGNIDLQNTRFIGTPKNKLHRDGGPRDPRQEVTFDGSRARFTD
jgi:replicative DNA helicase